MSSEQAHLPVLVEPILRLAEPQPGEVWLDGTVGLGGHAAAFVPRLAPGGTYLGLDLDPAMLTLARERVPEAADVTVRWFEANYAEFPDVLAAAGCRQVDGMLLDLGVNSAQLDDPARGFSFAAEGPLDMRFDPHQESSAIDLVNRLDETELADLFYQFGQERHSRRIARRICQARHRARLTTTRQLAEAVEAAAPPSAGKQKIHPATRVFQALRVAVNRELENLELFLSQVLAFLRPGGRLAVISFHSLEDGIVKRFVREAKADNLLEDLTRRPIVAGPEERKSNPRSRSAKLRVARRV